VFFSLEISADTFDTHEKPRQIPHFRHGLTARELFHFFEEPDLY